MAETETDTNGEWVKDYDGLKCRELTITLYRKVKAEMPNINFIEAGLIVSALAHQLCTDITEK